MSFKSGFVTIVGRPNVGKSTLLNRLTGEKIAITSDKPQTTRNAIKSIITTEEFQVIFIDTPGIHKPKNKLGDYMVTTAFNTLDEVDAVLFLVDATDSEPEAGDRFIIDRLKEIKTPVFLLINKIDLIPKEMLLSRMKAFGELKKFKTIIPVSALKADGISIIMDELKNILPEGPKYFPEDILTDQPEKLLAAELIREKMLHLLSDEIPHGTGVEVISFKQRENKDLLDIQANIYCEKESHKAIVIGKEGSMLKKIGSLARQEMENLLGSRIYLQLWVKVKPDWRNSDNMLRTLGYK